ncbi:hypothetical protein FACS1894181_07270 [Bacteroidia bacterium]|nr:hypothetical protein FACS1894181_07270 [Bacteroidia bacterium]
MLNKDEILRRTNNGLDVFKHYIAKQWRVGRNFLNPLYEDCKAYCYIYFDRMKGVYRLKDFGNDACSGDCFDFVGKLKGLDCGNAGNFVEILKTINSDLSLCPDENDTSFVVSVSPKPIQKAESSQQPEPPKKENPILLFNNLFRQKNFLSGCNTVLLPKH